MRRPRLIPAVLVACAHASPPNTGTTATTDDVHIRCEPRGNVVATGPTSDDIPLIALYERSTWMSGFDLPTLVVWADGSVVYSDKPYGKSLQLFQSNISTDGASEILRSTIALLRDAPAYTQFIEMTDQPSVEVIFRDGDAWRDIDIYGMKRDTRAKGVPNELRNVFRAYQDLLARRPTGRVPAASWNRRPEGWPERLPSYRGQTVIDQLAYCSYNRE